MERPDEVDREFRNHGYESVHPTSTTVLEMSGQFVSNNSYNKVSHINDTTSCRNCNDPADSSYADPYELRDSRSSDSDMLDNPLYEVVDESGDTMSASHNEHGYSVLDRGRHSVSEGPVESRPRKNIASTAEDEYSKLER